MSDTFCILPFVHLYSTTNGELRPCCIAGSFDDKPNIREGIESTFNSKEMRNLRKDMLNGVRNKVCDVCYKQEDLSLHSPRHSFNDGLKYKQYQMPEVEEDFSVASDFQYIDIRFSNLCNFKCIMCTHEFSSQWYEDMGYGQKGQFASPHEWRGDYQKNNTKIINISDNILDELIPHLSKLKRIYFAGGEPLIMKENYNLLDFLIKNNPSEISLHYNTNLSTLSYQGKSYMKLWEKFKRVHLAISCDGIGKVGEYQRVGFKTKKLMKNLSEIKKLFVCSDVKDTENKFTFGFQYTVTPINVYHIFDFMDYMFDNNIIKNYDEVYFSDTFGFYALENINDEEKYKIKKFLKENVKRYDSDYFKSNIDRIIKFMLNNSPSHTPLEVKDVTKFLDERNGQNYKDVTEIRFGKKLS